MTVVQSRTNARVEFPCDIIIVIDVVCSFIFSRVVLVISSRCHMYLSCVNAKYCTCEHVRLEIRSVGMLYVGARYYFDRIKSIVRNSIVRNRSCLIIVRSIVFLFQCLSGMHNRYRNSFSSSLYCLVSFIRKS
jgi:hypothetical protein